MKNKVVVAWDERSLASIRKAERLKVRLENAGYTLVCDEPGLIRGRLHYVKK